MPLPSPLLPVHQLGDGLLAPYGPPDSPVHLVEAFDPVEVEYASIRRHAAVFDAAHRATLVVMGADRVSFLNRMLTQELKALPPFESRRAFVLNRKGRIDADLRIISLADRILIDLDAFAADRARAELDKYIITEDAAITDETAAWSVLSLHGPAAAALIAGRSSPADGDPIGEIRPGRASVVAIAGHQVIVDRWDWTGEIGLDLHVPRAAATAVYDAISTPWDQRAASRAAAPTTALARRIGWHALNIARIEAGTAVYLLDFGPDSLPHECGDSVLADRVSFTKGCYLGQEIVARMQALGHPKQKLVGLRFAAGDGGARDHQPVTGTPLVDADAPGAAAIGAVTSSCLSPMLSQTPIALAMVKWSHATPGGTVWAQLDGARVAATVEPSTRFLR